MNKVKLEDVKVGDTLMADGGFTCISLGEKLVVKENESGELYVDCKKGTHSLDGQVDFDTGINLIGFTKLEEPNEPFRS